MTFSWQVIVTVFTLGGIGAVVRALVLMILGVTSLFYFPVGVLLINLLAAFLGGFIISLAMPEALHSIFVVGLLGGLGTLSAICSDVIDLYYDRVHRKITIVIGIVYILLSTVLGMLCAQGGIALSAVILDEKQSTNEQRVEQMIKQLEIKHGLDSVDEHQLPQMSPPLESSTLSAPPLPSGAAPATEITKNTAEED